MSRRRWPKQLASAACRTVDRNAPTTIQTITSPLFEVPTTAALFGNVLAAVNAKFDTGLPPTATQFEVILVRA